MDEKEIRSVVAGRRMSDADKAAIIARALAGDRGMLFIIAGWKRNPL